MLVLGYTLTDGADGECPVVPPALEDLALVSKQIRLAEYQLIN